MIAFLTFLSSGADELQWMLQAFSLMVDLQEASGNLKMEPMEMRSSRCFCRSMQCDSSYAEKMLNVLPKLRSPETDLFSRS